jgi:cyclopropane-fatty-acyl-phospholipid synthase
MNQLINAVARWLVLRALHGWRGGQLAVELPDGRVVAYGAGGDTLRVQVHHYRAFRALAFGGEVGAGESYMRGEWCCDRLPELIARVVEHGESVQIEGPFTWPTRIANRWRQRRRANSRHGSRQNIHAHYDLSNDLFRCFLDPMMHYSCAIFDDPTANLQEAQEAKCRLIAEKLDLAPSDHLLEIGCGWGGFAVYAAERFGCRVTAISISRAQFEFARQRVIEARLESQIDLQLLDYRDVTGRYDKIVSIEMFEAVGREYWETYFEHCARLLVTDGRMLLQTIAVPEEFRGDRFRGTGWLQKHIFPGSVLPTVGEVEQTVRRTPGLVLEDVNEIGSHYVRTLQSWRERFRAHLDAVRALGFDEPFVRMWDYYLATCEALFATGYTLDVQLVLSQARQASALARA